MGKCQARHCIGTLLSSSRGVDGEEPSIQFPEVGWVVGVQQPAHTHVHRRGGQCQHQHCFPAQRLRSALIYTLAFPPTLPTPTPAMSSCAFWWWCYMVLKLALLTFKGSFGKCVHYLKLMSKQPPCACCCMDLNKCGSDVR